MTADKDVDNISEDERDGHMGTAWEEEVKAKEGRKERKEGRKEGREGGREGGEIN